MKTNIAFFTKPLLGLVSLALFATGCTKSRDAALPDNEVQSVYAISDFGNISDSPDAGFQTSTQVSLKTRSSNASANRATNETGFVSIDADKTDLPERLRFMFNNLEVAGQESSPFKIAFSVDSKFVTAYKVTNDISSLSIFERQIAISPSEIQMAVELQKATTPRAVTALSQKIQIAQKSRQANISKRDRTLVYVPIFKYKVLAKGVLERTRNELRESTSVLTLRETEFSKATHIKLSLSSDDRMDIGSVEQTRDLEQLYTTNSIDNQTSSAGDLQSRFNFKMKFVADDTQVFTKLDSSDMKVFELTNISQLNADEVRQLNTGRANGEIMRCSEQSAVSSKDKNCVLRLIATVPVTYKNVRLNLADKNANTLNTLELLKVSKTESSGLVEIAREVRAERARPTGSIDPLSTIKLSDLKGDFYFRRTFEDASNMMIVGQAGTSGDMAIVNFELEKTRLVIRNQRALIEYAGQTAKDKEEMISVPVKYFKMEKVDADGVTLQVGKLIETTKEDAEYLEIDWTKNTIPVANSPLAYYSLGNCLKTQSSQTVTDMDMRLSNDGIMNFSLAGSYSVDPNCANQAQSNGAYFGTDAQFNYNVVERLSFKKKTDPSQDIQFASGLSPEAQNSMNFAIFTLANKKTGANVRDGRVNSESYKPVIHDFRNGKVLKYWIGGLQNAPAERREMITKATQEVVAEWNEAFHRAFKGSELDRTGDYIQLMTEDDSNRGHLGDLDRNYLWFMDMPAENGLLGVAQPAPNPNSGIIVANNVIVYSGNSEKEVRGFVQSYSESRAYEKLLEDAKRIAIEDARKEQAEEAAQAAQSNSQPGPEVVDRVNKQATQSKSYLNRIALAARPTTIPKMTSLYGNYINKNSKVGKYTAKDYTRRNLVNDVQITSDKSFTRNVMQQLLQSEFKDDPIMLEAIIAKELARTEPGMSDQMKALLRQQANSKIMTLKFNQAAKRSGGCFLYTSDYYNDKFLATGFEDLFKKEVKATLSHEMGHALGLVHNFKASYDRENFNFEGENTDRNYTSIMDYLASTEMGYHGPGPYDVHALRAIYTNRVELSDAAKKMGGVITLDNGQKVSMNVMDGRFININQAQEYLQYFAPIASEADMRKQTVDSTGLLKHYGQCNDSQVGEEPGCMRYDSGSSATEVVQAAIRGYNRSYITSYHAADRLNFGIGQKIAVMKRAIQTFQTIRATLDTFFQLVIFKTARSQEELINYRDASYLGYDFFHNLIRTPDTRLPYGNNAQEIAKRLTAVAYKKKVPRTTKNANGRIVPAVDSSGKALFDESTDIKILEARSTYDAASTADRFDTIGIGYDKAFALEFLLTANPTTTLDDSQAGWISFNEFEQYFLGVKEASESLNMTTMLEIMSNRLQEGFVDDAHSLINIEKFANINRSMLDGAILGSIAYPNSYRTMGLDSFAEFFKVGTLKAGTNIADRLSVPRFGQDESSAAAIKFYATDNAVGSDYMVSMAARKTVYMSNKDELSQLISAMLKADIQSSARMGQLNAQLQEELKTNKEQTLEKLAAADQQAQILQKASKDAADKLTARLTELNKKGVLLTEQELKANPNLSLASQVSMLRGMLVNTQGLLSQVVAVLPTIPAEKLSTALPQISATLQKQRPVNEELAQLDLLAFGQEILGEVIGSRTVTLTNKQKIPVADILAILMPKARMTQDLQTLMYSIEMLSRYTRQLNPEYAN